MQNNDSNNDGFEPEEEDVYALVQRFEKMLHENERAYFDIEEFEIIIDHYIWTDNAADAILATNIADSFFPDSNNLKIRRAEIFILKNDSYNALKLLDQLERVEPNNPQINFTKAKANIEAGNTREVNRQFELAINKESENVFDILMQIADYLIGIVNFELALKYLKRAYELEPHNSDMLYQTAYCYDRLNDWDNCILFYEKCLDEDPFDEGVWHNLGTIYGRRNQHDKAIEAFNFALTVNESYEPSLYNKANTLANLERYDESVEVFNEFLKLEPNNLYAYCTIGECYEKMGQYEKAIENYVIVIDIDKNFPEAYYGLSVVMLRQGNYDESAMYITQALEIDPENADFWFGSGELLHKTEHKEDAYLAFQKTVEYNPYDIEAWVYMSDIQSELNNTEAALLTLKKAYAHNFNSPQLCFRLATMYFLQHDIPNCIVFFEKGMSLNPLFAESFFTLCPDAENDTTIMNLYKQNKNYKAE